MRPDRKKLRFLLFPLLLVPIRVKCLFEVPPGTEELLEDQAVKWTSRAAWCFSPCLFFFSLVRLRLSEKRHHARVCDPVGQTTKKTKIGNTSAAVHSIPIFSGSKVKASISYIFVCLRPPWGGNKKGNCQHKCHKCIQCKQSQAHGLFLMSTCMSTQGEETQNLAHLLI